MSDNKITFALYFGNRGFFPGEVIAEARDEVMKAVNNAGYDYIALDANLTRYGAVETIKEGKIYADFLEANRGKFDGVILCLPNFGDENGAYVALKDAGVPILVQAYPDEIGKMDFAHRRDALCGKFAICNILRQADIPYSLTDKFVVDPKSDEFKRELDKFASVCRVVRGMRCFNVGAIGARTTPFKTVRLDEIALQKKGINVETIDLSELFARVRKVSDEDMNKAKTAILNISEFSGFPESKLDMMAKVQVALESIIADYDLQAVGIRCWNEFESELGIAPCTSLSLLGDMGIPAACEVDMENAVMMRALSLASDSIPTLLDYNNNYGDDINKAIMFHCGPVPSALTEGKGKICEHLSFKKTLGALSGVGVNIKTEDGKIYAFVTEGKFTDDPIVEEFFGSGKVCERENLNAVSNYMGNNGYKHHLCVVFGNVQDIIVEAFSKYLGYEIAAI